MELCKRSLETLLQQNADLLSSFLDLYLQPLAAAHALEAGGIRDALRSLQESTEKVLAAITGCTSTAALPAAFNQQEEHIALLLQFSHRYHGHVSSLCSLGEVVDVSLQCSTRARAEHGSHSSSDEMDDEADSRCFTSTWTPLQLLELPLSFPLAYLGIFRQLHGLLEQEQRRAQTDAAAKPALPASGRLPTSSPLEQASATVQGLEKVVLAMAENEQRGQLQQLRQLLQTELVFSKRRFLLHEGDFLLQLQVGVQEHSYHSSSSMAGEGSGGAAGSSTFDTTGLSLRQPAAAHLWVYNDCVVLALLQPQQDGLSLRLKYHICLPLCLGSKLQWLQENPLQPSSRGKDGSLPSGLRLISKAGGVQSLQLSPLCAEGMAAALQPSQPFTLDIMRLSLLEEAAALPSSQPSAGALQDEKQLQKLLEALEQARKGAAADPLWRSYRTLAARQEKMASAAADSAASAVQLSLETATSLLHSATSATAAASQLPAAAAAHSLASEAPLAGPSSSTSSSSLFAQDSPTPEILDVALAVADALHPPSLAPFQRLSMPAYSSDFISAVPLEQQQEAFRALVDAAAAQSTVFEGLLSLAPCTAGPLSLPSDAWAAQRVGGRLRVLQWQGDSIVAQLEILAGGASASTTASVAHTVALQDLAAVSVLSDISAFLPSPPPSSLPQAKAAAALQLHWHGEAAGAQAALFFATVEEAQAWAIMLCCLLALRRRLQEAGHIWQALRQQMPMFREGEVGSSPVPPPSRGQWKDGSGSSTAAHALHVSEAIEGQAASASLITASAAAVEAASEDVQLSLSAVISLATEGSQHEELLRGAAQRKLAKEQEGKAAAAASMGGLHLTSVAGRGHSGALDALANAKSGFQIAAGITGTASSSMASRSRQPSSAGLGDAAAGSLSASASITAAPPLSKDLSRGVGLPALEAAVAGDSLAIAAMREGSTADHRSNSLSSVPASSLSTASVMMQTAATDGADAVAATSGPAFAAPGSPSRRGLQAYLQASEPSGLLAEALQNPALLLQQQQQQQQQQLSSKDGGFSLSAASGKAGMGSQEEKEDRIEEAEAEEEEEEQGHAAGTQARPSHRTGGVAGGAASAHGGRSLSRQGSRSHLSRSSSSSGGQLQPCLPSEQLSYRGRRVGAYDLLLQLEKGTTASMREQLGMEHNTHYHALEFTIGGRSLSLPSPQQLAREDPSLCIPTEEAAYVAAMPRWSVPRKQGAPSPRACGAYSLLQSLSPALQIVVEGSEGGSDKRSEKEAGASAPSLQRAESQRRGTTASVSFAPQSAQLPREEASPAAAVAAALPSSGLSPLAAAMSLPRHLSQQELLGILLQQSASSLPALPSAMLLNIAADSLAVDDIPLQKALATCRARAAVLQRKQHLGAEETLLDRSSAASLPVFTAFRSLAAASMQSAGVLDATGEEIGVSLPSEQQLGSDFLLPSQWRKLAEGESAAPSLLFPAINPSQTLSPVEEQLAFTPTAQWVRGMLPISAVARLSLLQPFHLPSVQSLLQLYAERGQTRLLLEALFFLKQAQLEISPAFFELLLKSVAAAGLPGQCEQTYWQLPASVRAASGHSCSLVVLQGYADTGLLGPAKAFFMALLERESGTATASASATGEARSSFQASSRHYDLIILAACKAGNTAYASRLCKLMFLQQLALGDGSAAAAPSATSLPSSLSSSSHFNVAAVDPRDCFAARQALTAFDLPILACPDSRTLVALMEGAAHAGQAAKARAIFEALAEGDGSQAHALGVTVTPFGGIKAASASSSGTTQTSSLTRAAVASAVQAVLRSGGQQQKGAAAAATTAAAASAAAFVSSASSHEAAYAYTLDSRLLQGETVRAAGLPSSATMPLTVATARDPTAQLGSGLSKAGWASGAAVHATALPACCDPQQTYISRMSLYSLILLARDRRRRGLFQQFPAALELTPAAFAACIKAHARAGELQQARSMFDLLRARGALEQQLLSAGSKHGNIHVAAHRCQWRLTTSACNALLQGYAGRGTHGPAPAAAGGIGSAVSGNAAGGLPPDFDGLKNVLEIAARNGVQPNAETFALVIRACGRAGLLAEARAVFALQCDSSDWADMQESMTELLCATASAVQSVWGLKEGSGAQSEASSTASSSEKSWLAAARPRLDRKYFGARQELERAVVASKAALFPEGSSSPSSQVMASLLADATALFLDLSSSAVELQPSQAFYAALTACYSAAGDHHGVLETVEKLMDSGSIAGDVIFHVLAAAEEDASSGGSSSSSSSAQRLARSWSSTLASTVLQLQGANNAGSKPEPLTGETQCLLASLFAAADRLQEAEAQLASIEPDTAAAPALVQAYCRLARVHAAHGHLSAAKAVLDACTGLPSTYFALQAVQRDMFGTVSDPQEEGVELQLQGAIREALRRAQELQPFSSDPRDLPTFLKQGIASAPSGGRAGAGAAQGAPVGSAWQEGSSQEQQGIQLKAQVSDSDAEKGFWLAGSLGNPRTAGSGKGGDAAEGEQPATAVSPSSAEGYVRGPSRVQAATILAEITACYAYLIAQHQEMGEESRVSPAAAGLVQQTATAGAPGSSQTAAYRVLSRISRLSPEDGEDFRIATAETAAQDGKSAARGAPTDLRTFPTLQYKLRLEQQEQQRSRALRAYVTGSASSSHSFAGAGSDSPWTGSSALPRSPALLLQHRQDLLLQDAAYLLQRYRAFLKQHKAAHSCLLGLLRGRVASSSLCAAVDLPADAAFLFPLLFARSPAGKAQAIAEAAALLAGPFDAHFGLLCAYKPFQQKQVLLSVGLKTYEDAGILPSPATVKCLLQALTSCGKHAEVEMALQQLFASALRASLQSSCLVCTAGGTSAATHQLRGSRAGGSGSAAAAPSADSSSALPLQLLSCYFAWLAFQEQVVQQRMQSAAACRAGTRVLSIWEEYVQVKRQLLQSLRADADRLQTLAAAADPTFILSTHRKAAASTISFWPGGLAAQLPCVRNSQAARSRWLLLQTLAGSLLQPQQLIPLALHNSYLLCISACVSVGSDSSATTSGCASGPTAGSGVEEMTENACVRAGEGRAGGRAAAPSHAPLALTDRPSASSLGGASTTLSAAVGDAGRSSVGQRLLAAAFSDSVRGSARQSSFPDHLDFHSPATAAGPAPFSATQEHALGQAPFPEALTPALAAAVAREAVKTMAGAAVGPDLQTLAAVSHVYLSAGLAADARLLLRLALSPSREQGYSHQDFRQDLKRDARRAAAVVLQAGRRSALLKSSGSDLSHLQQQLVEDRQLAEQELEELATSSAAALHAEFSSSSSSSSFPSLEEEGLLASSSSHHAAAAAGALTLQELELLDLGISDDGLALGAGHWQPQAMPQLLAVLTAASHGTLDPPALLKQLLGKLSVEGARGGEGAVAEEEQHLFSMQLAGLLTAAGKASLRLDSATFCSLALSLGRAGCLAELETLVAYADESSRSLEGAVLPEQQVLGRSAGLALFSARLLAGDIDAAEATLLDSRIHWQREFSNSSSSSGGEAAASLWQQQQEEVAVNSSLQAAALIQALRIVGLVSNGRLHQAARLLEAWAALICKATAARAERLLAESRVADEDDEEGKGEEEERASEGKAADADLPTLLPLLSSAVTAVLEGCSALSASQLLCRPCEDAPLDPAQVPYLMARLLLGEKAGMAAAAPAFSRAAAAGASSSSSSSTASSTFISSYSGGLCLLPPSSCLLDRLEAIGAALTSCSETSSSGRSTPLVAFPSSWVSQQDSSSSSSNSGALPSLRMQCWSPSCQDIAALVRLYSQVGRVVTASNLAWWWLDASFACNKERQQGHSRSTLQASRQNQQLKSLSEAFLRQAGGEAAVAAAASASSGGCLAFGASALSTPLSFFAAAYATLSGSDTSGTSSRLDGTGKAATAGSLQKQVQEEEEDVRAVVGSDELSSRALEAQESFLSSHFPFWSRKQRTVTLRSLLSAPIPAAQSAAEAPVGQLLSSSLMITAGPVSQPGTALHASLLASAQLVSQQEEAGQGGDGSLAFAGGRSAAAAALLLGGKPRLQYLKQLLRYDRKQEGEQGRGRASGQGGASKGSAAGQEDKAAAKEAALLASGLFSAFLPATAGEAEKHQQQVATQGSQGKKNRRGSTLEQKLLSAGKLQLVGMEDSLAASRARLIMWGLAQEQLPSQHSEEALFPGLQCRLELASAEPSLLQALLLCLSQAPPVAYARGFITEDCLLATLAASRQLQLPISASSAALMSRIAFRIEHAGGTGGRMRVAGGSSSSSSSSSSGSGDASSTSASSGPWSMVKGQQAHSAAGVAHSFPSSSSSSSDFFSSQVDLLMGQEQADAAMKQLSWELSSWLQSKQHLLPQQEGLLQSSEGWEEGQLGMAAVSSSAERDAAPTQSAAYVDDDLQTARLFGGPEDGLRPYTAASAAAATARERGSAAQGLPSRLGIMTASSSAAATLTAESQYATSRTPSFSAASAYLQPPHQSTRPVSHAGSEPPSSAGQAASTLEVVKQALQQAQQPVQFGLWSGTLLQLLLRSGLLLPARPASYHPSILRSSAGLTAGSSAGMSSSTPGAALLHISGSRKAGASMDNDSEQSFAALILPSVLPIPEARRLAAPVAQSLLASAGFACSLAPRIPSQGAAAQAALLQRLQQRPKRPLRLVPSLLRLQLELPLLLLVGGVPVVDLQQRLQEEQTVAQLLLQQALPGQSYSASGVAQRGSTVQGQFASHTIGGKSAIPATAEPAAPAFFTGAGVAAVTSIVDGPVATPAKGSAGAKPQPLQLTAAVPELSAVVALLPDASSPSQSLQLQEHGHAGTALSADFYSRSAMDELMLPRQTMPHSQQLHYLQVDAEREREEQRLQELLLQRKKEAEEEALLSRPGMQEAAVKRLEAEVVVLQLELQEVQAATLTAADQLRQLQAEAGPSSSSSSNHGMDTAVLQEHHRALHPLEKPETQAPAELPEEGQGEGEEGAGSHGAMGEGLREDGEKGSEDQPPASSSPVNVRRRFVGATAVRLQEQTDVAGVLRAAQQKGKKRGAQTGAQEPEQADLTPAEALQQQLFDLRSLCTTAAARSFPEPVVVEQHILQLQVALKELQAVEQLEMRKVGLQESARKLFQRFSSNQRQLAAEEQGLEEDLQQCDTAVEQAVQELVQMRARLVQLQTAVLELEEEQEEEQRLQEQALQGREGMLNKAILQNNQRQLVLRVNEKVARLGALSGGAAALGHSRSADAGVSSSSSSISSLLSRCKEEVAALEAAVQGEAAVAVLRAQTETLVRKAKEAYRQQREALAAAEESHLSAALVLCSKLGKQVEQEQEAVRQLKEGLARLEQDSALLAGKEDKLLAAVQSFRAMAEALMSERDSGKQEALAALETVRKGGAASTGPASPAAAFSISPGKVGRAARQVAAGAADPSSPAKQLSALIAAEKEKGGSPIHPPLSGFSLSPSLAQASGSNPAPATGTGLLAAAEHVLLRTQGKAAAAEARLQLEERVALKKHLQQAVSDVTAAGEAALEEMRKSNLAAAEEALQEWDRKQQEAKESMKAALNAELAPLAQAAERTAAEAQHRVPRLEQGLAEAETELKGMQAEIVALQQFLSATEGAVHMPPKNTNTPSSTTACTTLLEAFGEQLMDAASEHVAGAEDVLDLVEELEGWLEAEAFQSKPQRPLPIKLQQLLEEEGEEKKAEDEEGPVTEGEEEGGQSSEREGKAHGAPHLLHKSKRVLYNRLSVHNRMHPATYLALQQAYLEELQALLGEEWRQQLSSTVSLALDAPSAAAMAGSAAAFSAPPKQALAAAALERAGEHASAEDATDAAAEEEQQRAVQEAVQLLSLLPAQHSRGDAVPAAGRQRLGQGGSAGAAKKDENVALLAEDFLASALPQSPKRGAHSTEGLPEQQQHRFPRFTQQLQTLGILKEEKAARRRQEDEEQQLQHEASKQELEQQQQLLEARFRVKRSVRLAIAQEAGAAGAGGAAAAAGAPSTLSRRQVGSSAQKAGWRAELTAAAAAAAAAGGGGGGGQIKLTAAASAGAEAALAAPTPSAARANYGPQLVRRGSTGAASIASLASAHSSLSSSITVPLSGSIGHVGRSVGRVGDRVHLLASEAAAEARELLPAEQDEQSLFFTPSQPSAQPSAQPWRRQQEAGYQQPAVDWAASVLLGGEPASGNPLAPLFPPSRGGGSGSVARRGEAGVDGSWSSVNAAFSYRPAVAAAAGAVPASAVKASFAAANVRRAGSTAGTVTTDGYSAGLTAPAAPFSGLFISPAAATSSSSSSSSSASPSPGFYRSSRHVRKAVETIQQLAPAPEEY